MTEQRSHKRRAPSLEDVARIAGVNRVTASIALRRGSRDTTREGTRISEATRQRVVEAADSLGYSPNAIALALRRQSTGLIGFYGGYGEWMNAHLPFIAELINGLQFGCVKRQHHLLFYTGFEDHTVDERYRILANGSIDGLIVFPAPSHIALLERLAHSHVPLIAIANPQPAIPSVTVDNAHGSYLLAEHLAAQGHRRVLYRCGNFDHTSASIRRNAFLEAAQKFGLEVIISPPETLPGNLTAFERELLQQPRQQRPTAAVCWEDMSAYILLQDCERYGITVPDDLAIVGFDGIETRIHPCRSLTTIRAPWNKVAETATDLLLDLIHGRGVAPETILPVSLVVGDTA
ncbi:LacI family DNA-binding transcriptional regulator [Tengunoibacter tsumagoiensis]|uniref:HTH-type transcriptional repressor PurR n=1 Tax=Tengunoibacter tsumagoiensis TaxID=2014871 RepID=A0A402A9T4_9CHLR|nr:LacI family DNA-binding transcriptional regulator [Tengunoibacter tsumagoiensis]GCE15900.1 HTH-type transcriptional repressor PurR [Tengunoibacter tsumagoiensis]